MNWLCRWFGWGCPDPEPVSLPSDQIGVCVGNTAGNPDLIDAAVATGIGWVRLDAYWHTLEPEQGRWDWWIARDVERARDLGLNVYLTLHDAPDWAADDGVPRLEPWMRFVEKAVERLPSVEVFAVWNEPNAPQFFSGTVEDYIPLLEAASPIIRDAGARVAAPDLATADWLEWRGWLDEVMVSSISSIDLLSVHHYGTAEGARRLIEELDSPVPVWLTETSHGHHRDPEAQAAQLREVFRLQSETPGWEVTMPYHWYADSDYIIQGTEAESVISSTARG